MDQREKLQDKYNYLLNLFKKDRAVLARLMRKYSALRKDYLRLKRYNGKAVKDMMEKLVEDKYQMIFNQKRKIISISKEFLEEIEMTLEEFQQSFYVDLLFDKFFPPLPFGKKEAQIPPFHLPILLKNYMASKGQIHPYIHYQFSGVVRNVKSKGAFYYFLNLKDISSEVELNYIQNTDTLITSLSISNLHLQKAKKSIEVQKIMLIFLICSLFEEYSKETSEHLRRIQDITTILSKECLRLGLIQIVDYDKEEYVKDVNYTSVLHDIGKMGVPNEVLSKKGKLTPEEREIIQNHTKIGAAYIDKIIVYLSKNADYSTYTNFLKIPYEICLYHHEKWDGTGYPQGLKEEEIPIAARIVAVADTYDAIRGNRSYDKGRTHEEALGILIQASGTQFDPEIVKAFVNVQSEFCMVKY